eukprot:jgi/Undpi1/13079/HiC_scaffold_8.g02741.m1
MRAHRRSFALVGAGLLTPCFAFVPSMHQFCAVQGLSRAHADRSATSGLWLNQDGHEYRGQTRSPRSYEHLRRPRTREYGGVSYAKGTGDAKGDGDGDNDTAVSEARTNEDRTDEINKQVYQSEYLVGSKMMTISSFGPDSVASAPWRAGKGSAKVNTRSTVAPEAMMPEAACSFSLGVALGTAYLVLLSRFVENLGKEESGGGREGGGGGGGGPARLALAGLLVLLVSKNKESLEFIPALTGFFAYQVATLVQGVYTDFDDIEDAESAR